MALLSCITMASTALACVVMLALSCVPAVGATGCSTSGLLSPEVRLNTSSVQLGADLSALTGVATLQVTISLSHPSATLVTAALQSPNNMYITLFGASGPFSMTNIQFQKSGPFLPQFPGTVVDQTYAISSNWDSTQAQPAGTWKLLLASASPSQDDILHSWSLTICDRNFTSTATPTATATPANIQTWALTTLYTSTGGGSWRRADNWLVMDPCVNGWYGVTCVGNTVVQVDLSSNLLTGPLPLPDLLRGLPQLRSLNLSSNRLTGNLVVTTQHATLQDLVLRNNSFAGVLPAAIFSFPLLQVVDVSLNSLSGTIPVFWPATGTLGLRLLNLSNNNFAGTLSNPTFSISQQPLEVFSISHNPNLRGSFPSRLFTVLKNVRIIEAAYTGLSGAIPTDLPALPYLQQLALSNSQFSSLPYGVGSAQLQRVELDRNNFQGALPDWVFSPQLRVLQVQGNGLAGPINFPSGVMPSLQLIDLSDNQFTEFLADNATFANQFGTGAVLNLTYNLLSGPVPDYLANQPNVYLRGNRWDCQLPAFSWGDKATTACWVTFQVTPSSPPQSSLQCGSGQLRTNYNFTVSAPVPHVTFAVYTEEEVTDILHPYVEYSLASSTATLATGRCLLPAGCAPEVSTLQATSFSLELIFFSRTPGPLVNFTVEVATSAPLIFGSNAHTSPLVGMPSTAVVEAITPTAAAPGGNITFTGTCMVPGPTICSYTVSGLSFNVSGHVTTAYRAICSVPEQLAAFNATPVYVSLSIDGGLTFAKSFALQIIGAPTALALSAGAPLTRSAAYVVPNISLTVTDQKGFPLPAFALRQYVQSTLGTAFEAPYCLFQNTTLATAVSDDGSTFLASAAFPLSWPLAGAYPVICYLPLLQLQLRAAIQIWAGNPVNLTIVQQPSALSDNRHALDQQPVVAFVDAAGNRLLGPVLPLGATVRCRSVPNGLPAGFNCTASGNSSGYFAFNGISIVGVYGVAYALQFYSQQLPAAAIATASAVTVQPCSQCAGSLLPVSGSSTCVACPVGGVCGITDQPAAMPGYWSWSPSVLLPCPSYNPSILDRTRRTSYCTGGTKGHQCTPGHGGPLCSICVSGWGRVIDQSCAKCRERKSSYALFSFTFIAYGLVVGFVALASLRLDSTNTGVIIFRMTVDHCQTLFRIGEVLRGAWPLLLQHLFDKAHYISEFPLRLAFMQCGPFWTPFARYIAYMLIPPVVSTPPAILMAFYMLLPDAPSVHFPYDPQNALSPPPELKGAFPYRSRVRRVYSIAQTTLACILVGFLVSYSIVIHYSAAWLYCENFPGGEAYLSFDRDVNCHTAQYRRYRKAAISTLTIYGIGMLFLPLLAYLAVKGGRGEMVARRLLSYPVGGFRPFWWWWYVFVSMRKLILVLLLIFIHSMEIRATLVVLLLVTAFAMQLAVRPYDDHNGLENLSLAANIFTMVLGPIFLDTNPVIVHMPVRRFVTVIIFIFQVFVILAHLFFLLREGTRKLNWCFSPRDPRANPNSDVWDPATAGPRVPKEATTPLPPYLPYSGAGMLPADIQAPTPPS
eukprot:TRINITY_DN3651_c0_g1_i1.p1 TRINITY_DN3651_c0_g1~~TRINITY_DN3651_c0_g1_i1.p1  ORF type:complete len:1550 (-),score=193.13 TRINITY_DN3651_c0_g1_i1:56-4669(-)